MGSRVTLLIPGAGRSFPEAQVKLEKLVSSEHANWVDSRRQADKTPNDRPA